MDTTVTMPEDNCQTSNCNRGSKSLESSIKIDSISIDLISTNERTGAEKCEHFSIRGFVSEVRKKDWKKCWPFTSDGDSNHYEEQICLLPPLHVPRYKFWRCENCLQELEAKCISNNPVPGLKSHSSELKSNKLCTHTSAFSDAIRILSHYQQGPKPDSLAGKIVDGSGSANLNQATEYQPLLCVDLKEKSSNAVSNPAKGNGTKSKAKRSQEIDISATVSMEVIPSPKQKTCFVDNKASESKRHGKDEACKSGYAPADVSNATLTEKHLSIKNTAKMCGTGKEKSAYQERKELISVAISDEAEDGELEPDAMGRSLMEGHPSVGITVCDDASSRSAETMITNDLEDCSNDNSGGLPHRRRARKVRLLTELLCENGDGVGTKNRSQDSQLNEISDASAGAEKLPPPDGQAGYCRRVSGHGKKRKTPQDENWRPIGISFPNKARKNSKMIKKDVEAADATANTEDLEIAFAKMNLHSGKKNHFAKDKVDKSASTGKRKRQKTWSASDGSPSASSLENIAKETKEKLGYPSTSNAIIDSVSDKFKTREMDLFPLPVRRLEPEQSNDKMKSKSHDVDNHQASEIVWNDSIQREGLMARKDGDGSCSGSASHQFRLDEDASLDKALNLSLNSYVPTQKIDFNCFQPLEEGRNSLVTWQGITAKDPVVRKGSEMKYVENFGNIPGPASIASTGASGVLSGKRPDAYNMPFLNEKQNYASKVQIGSRAMQHKDFCGASSQGKSTGVQDSAILLNGNRLAGKGSEQGAADFPMEIVELMAKNQYERCLPDSEHNKRQLESSIRSGNSQMIDFSKVHGHRELSFAVPKQMSQTKTGRNLAVVGSTVHNPVDFFAQADRTKVRMGQHKQASTTVGFRPFLEHQEKPSSGLQPSLSSSSKPNSPHARKWIEDVTGKMSACTGYPNSRSCNTCQSTPQQNRESKQLWSPLVTNQMPFVYNFPQNGAGPSTNFLACFPESSRKDNSNLNRDLKFLSQTSPNLRKRTRNFVSEIPGGARVDDPFSCRHKGAEVNQKPVAPLDLYSNETIPAMHLLSLMDAGLSSSAPMSVDGNHKLFKRPPIAPPKKASGAYRNFNTIKIPPYGKSQLAGCHEPIPGIPNTFGVSSSSFSNDRSFKRVTNCASQVSQVKEKRKGPDLCMPNNTPKLQASASTSVPFGANCGSIPVHSMQAIFSAASDPKTFSSQLPLLQNLKQKLDTPSAVVPVNHHKSSVKTEVCSINRNPADFSIPDTRNIYMIAGEDLKFGTSVPPAKGTGIIKPGRKRRPRMLATGKEKGQPSAS